MESFDAIIVGGGPAGSTCAWKLQRGGMNVLILDKKDFPRDKPCAGWITPQVVDDLHLEVDDYRQQRTWQPITGFRCGVIGGREIPVSYGKPISYGIRRREFDAYLLRRCGAALRLSESIGSIERQADGWLINGAYRAPLLVGAGGNFCPVARFLGARRDSPASVVVAQEIEFKATQEQFGNVAETTPALFFCRDLAGYGWCFRKGEYLNIGLGRTDPARLSAHVAQFRQFLADRQIADCGSAPWVGHAYQLYDHVQPLLVEERVLLVGDAAGLAYAQSGEGIRPAIESSLIAADVILAAEGRYGREGLAPYQTRLADRLGKPPSGNLLGWLPAAWLHALASRLLVKKWFSRHVVMDKWFLRSADKALTL